MQFDESSHEDTGRNSDGYGSIPIDTFLGGWTSIYQLYWCELQGDRVLTHPQICRSEAENEVAENPPELTGPVLRLLRWVRWNCEDSSSNICLVVWNMTFISIIYGIYSQPCRDIWWNIWYIYILIGGLEHDFYFPYIGNVIIPTDELHDFSSRYTSNQTCLWMQYVSCAKTHWVNLTTRSEIRWTGLPSMGHGRQYPMIGWWNYMNLSHWHEVWSL